MTTLAPTDLQSLADRFVASLRALDVEGISALFAPGAIVWHSFDDLEIDAQDAMANLAPLKASFGTIDVVEVRRLLTDSGFVLQFELRASGADGATLHSRNCIIVDVDEGGIRRLSEYFDMVES
jgi:hypothetical protein